MILISENCWYWGLPWYPNRNLPTQRKWILYLLWVLNLFNATDMITSQVASCPFTSMNKITHDSIYLILQDGIMSSCKEKSCIYFGVVCMKSFIYIFFCLLHCCFFCSFITHFIIHYQAGILVIVLVLKRVARVMNKTSSWSNSNINT